MERRSLGRTGIDVSVLGFGCAQIASMTTRYPPRDILATLGAALDLGVNVFDTADVYGQGDSERLLARALGHRRNDTVICTKAGLRIGPLQRAVRLVKPLVNPLLRRWAGGRNATIGMRERAERQQFEPGYLRACVEGSLHRLGTDRIDVFLLHSPPLVLPEADAVFAMLDALRGAGTIRCFGVSCRTLTDVDHWLAMALRYSIACLQVPVNPRTLAAARPLLARAATEGVGILVREPFAGGRIDTGPAFALKSLARTRGVDVVLAGMAGRAHLEANVAALRVGSAEPPVDGNACDAQRSSD